MIAGQRSNDRSGDLALSGLQRKKGWPALTSRPSFLLDHENSGMNPEHCRCNAQKFGLVTVASAAAATTSSTTAAATTVAAAATSSTTAATTTVAAATASTAATAATAATTTTTAFARTRFVDDNLATVKIRTVQSTNGFITTGLHLDKTESFGSACFAVADNLG